MAKHKKWQDKYEVMSELGEGGNAKVFRVKLKNSKKECALKELKARSKEKCGRFLDEIEIIKKTCDEIEGIFPILDYSKYEYWYTVESH